MARFPYLVLLAAASAGLAACEGSSDGMTDPVPVPVPGGGAPGRYAYVTSADNQGQSIPGTMYQFAIGIDGSLTPLAEPSVPTGVTPRAVIADATGRYVYVANLGDATISQYVVGTDGALTPMSAPTVAIPAPFATADGYWLSVDSTTNSLYVVVNALSTAATASSVAQFSIGGNGMLTSLTPAYVESSAAASGPLAIAPGGHSGYLAGAVGMQAVATQTGQVAQFSIGPDGVLSELTPASIASAGTPAGVTISPAGQTAYVLSRCVDSACDGEITEFGVGADGTLSATGMSVLTGGHVMPLALVSNAAGTSAYLLANFMGIDTNTGVIYQYAIDTAGGLIPDTPASLPISTGAVAVSAHGAHVYALSANEVGFVSGFPPGGYVDHYKIGSDGLLTAAGTTQLPGGVPTALAVVGTQ